MTSEFFRMFLKRSYASNTRKRKLTKMCSVIRPGRSGRLFFVIETPVYVPASPKRGRRNMDFAEHLSLPRSDAVTDLDECPAVTERKRGRCVKAFSTLYVYLAAHSK
ncbi:hypothetical protein ABVK25_001244 [Lepraria finkii]|uniref:Uncharacterized protein n=1 Tax=Lepraria finkii TaxID=1340010 RepID=A0ABR4BNX0_9LECA